MAMVMVVSVRARELAAERVCVLVCESVFLFLSCWWQRLNKNARILYGIISSTCTEHIKPMCTIGSSVYVCAFAACSYTVHLWFVCTCVSVCVYMVFYTPADHACVYVYLLCVWCCWRWLLTVDAGWRFCSSSNGDSDHRKYKHWMCTFKIDSGSKTGFNWAERRKRESEKTIKNHIHLKRKIQIQWISAVACCYINQNPIYLSCRRDWFNGICIDRCFITFYCSFFVLLIWLAQWSSKFHFSG